MIPYVPGYQGKFRDWQSSGLLTGAIFKKVSNLQKDLKSGLQALPEAVLFKSAMQPNEFKLLSQNPSKSGFISESESA